MSPTVRSLLLSACLAAAATPASAQSGWSYGQGGTATQQVNPSGYVQSPSAAAAPVPGYGIPSATGLGNYATTGAAGYGAGGYGAGVGGYGGNYGLGTTYGRQAAPGQVLLPAQSAATSEFQGGGYGRPGIGPGGPGGPIPGVNPPLAIGGTDDGTSRTDGVTQPDRRAVKTAQPLASETSTQPKVEYGPEPGSYLHGEAKALSTDVLSFQGQAVHVSGILGVPNGTICKRGVDSWHCGDEGLRTTEQLLEMLPAHCRVIQAATQDAPADGVCTVGSGNLATMLLERGMGLPSAGNHEGERAAAVAKAQGLGIWGPVH